MPNVDITVGFRVGRLTVLKGASSDNGKRWLCLCECGVETIVRAGHLLSGGVKSCGCLAKDTAAATSRATAERRKTHGLSHTPLNECYKNMVRRCCDPKNKSWARYGSRGIRVCNEWLSKPQSFYDWAQSNGYAEGLTIERKDTNGNYDPANCTWATRRAQSRNTSRNHLLAWNGEELPVCVWAERLGVRPQAMENRVARGWPAERIFGQPFRESRYPSSKTP